MIRLFKKSLPKRIKDLVDKLLPLVYHKNLDEINLAGIIDGGQIIREFIECNESRLAIDHLVYLLIETETKISSGDEKELLEICNKLNLNNIDLKIPSSVEIDEFYRIVSLFNEAQNKVVEILKQKWNIKTPISSHDWVEWRVEALNNKTLMSIEGIQIYPHGHGLWFQNNEFNIDFDFGENGEYNGFDSNRIYHFLESNKIETSIESEKRLMKILEFEYTNERLIFSGYINYYKK